MISYMYIRSCFWVIGFFSLAGSLPWVDPSLERLDELNDAEIYKAIVNSMNEWQKKHDLKKSTNRTKREDASICYPELGCFEASGPFGYLDMLPSKPEEINTKFLLYPARTRRRRSNSAPAEVPFEKIEEAFEWAKSGFNASLPTKVLIHGFGSDCGYIWAYEIRSALMAVEEVNTICVDWTNGAALPNYVKASANTRLVGKQLSLLLRGLVEKNGLSLFSTHLIGFSLGAHIAGFAGADLKNLSRITGLDPAGPLFESQDTRARLDQTDAAFVDVIHSNGENLILGGLGSSQPMGHVDFYPNGGRMQKGCSHLFVGAVSDIIWSSAVEGRSLCNHRRAYKFFIDSVSPRCHFPAFPCDSYDDFLAGKCFPCTEDRKCGNMGYYADRSKGRGQLFLITRDEEPFCAHQYLVKLETEPGPLPIKSYGKIQITLIGDSFLNETFMMTRKEDEEMKLGESISRIIVPHPILSQPAKIEILYTAYSGWLSSGLTQWKIDKVMLMDSFGKVLSVCKRNLILDSGVAVILPLYPGECNPPNGQSHKETEDRLEQPFNNTSKESFVPTQVIKVGLNDKEYESDKDKIDVPFKNDLVDNLAESSRAFNTRIIKADETNKHLADGDGLIKEIVEPILKPHSSKNARSHNPIKAKPEITEPILGPTTGRVSTTSPKSTTEGKVITFYDADWVPNKGEKTTEKWKRQDESKSLKGFETTTTRTENPIESIVTTVQFLPQRLARMFEQAEKYARDTLLPFVSTYTPRFISDIIRPREPPKYVPLHYDEEDEVPAEVKQVDEQKDESDNELKLSESRNIKAQDLMPLTTPQAMTTTSTETAPYTHIQRIQKKTDKINYIFPSSEESTSSEAPPKTSQSPPTTSKLQNVTNDNSYFSIDWGNRYNTSEKRKRQDDSRSRNNFRPIETIVNTFQIFPDSLQRMFNRAEKYARERIWPLVDGYVDEFVRNRQQKPQPEAKKETIDYTKMENEVKEEISTANSVDDGYRVPYSNVQKIQKSEKAYSQDFAPKLVVITPKVTTSTPKVTTTTITTTFKVMTTTRTTTPKTVTTTTEVTTTTTTPKVTTTTITTTPKATTTTRTTARTTTTPKSSTEMTTEMRRISETTTTIPESTLKWSTIVRVAKPRKHTKKTNMHVQKIPKRGEKVTYTLPKVIEIVIDPKDLETTTTTTTTTTAKPTVSMPYVSYIQKIPRKGAKAG